MLTCDWHVDLPWIQSKYYTFDLNVGCVNSQISFPKMKQGHLEAMFCALYLPDSWQELHGPEKSSDGIDWQVKRLRNQMGARLVDTALGATDAYIAGYTPIFLGLEGGRLLGDPKQALGRLCTMRNVGVRYLTLTHNLNTLWADSATDNPKHGGLTDFGCKVVEKCNELDVYVDVSHASDATAADALAVSEKPIVATHSGARALLCHPRNLSNVMIKAIASTGGIIGVPFARRFVGEDMSGVARHVDHMIQCIGDVNHVGIGSDLDGAAMVNGVRDVADWKTVVMDGLSHVGLSDSAIEAIAGGNILRLME